MDVSIVIINYNTFRLTCQCIDSVRRVVSGVEYEIILVDNHSTEISPKEFKKLYPNIILVESTENGGFAKGNNLGIKHARGEYILLLNSDTILLTDVASILYCFLLNNRKVAAVAPRLENADGTAQHNCQRFPSVRYQLFELARLQKILPRNIGGKILMGAFFDHQSVAFPDWIWGTCVMFQKRILELMPGKKLPDDFFMYCEDIQWCLEFRRLGFSIGFEPEAKITHLMGKSGGMKHELIQRNLDTLMQKYYSPFHRKCIMLLGYLLSPI